MDRDISHYDERFKSRNRDSEIDQRLKTEKEVVYYDVDVNR